MNPATTPAGICMSKASTTVREPYRLVSPRVSTTGPTALAPTSTLLACFWSGSAGSDAAGLFTASIGDAMAISTLLVGWCRRYQPDSWPGGIGPDGLFQSCRVRTPKRSLRTSADPAQGTARQFP